MFSFHHKLITKNNSILRNYCLNRLIRRCHASGGKNETKVTFSNGY